MKRSPDNQINDFLIDISRIKWKVFFFMVVFLPHNETVGKLRSIDQRPVEQTAYLT